MRTPKERLLGLYERVYSRRLLTVALYYLSLLASLVIALSYAAVLCFELVRDLVYGAQFLAVTSIPFLLGTLLRHIINRPRPYEVLDTPLLEGLRAGGRRGESFPSRHTLSAMLIGSAICFIHLPLGIVLLGLGICVGACRVLLGYHFLSDVLAGGAIGALSGVVGMIIVNFS